MPSNPTTDPAVIPFPPHKGQTHIQPNSANTYCLRYKEQCRGQTGSWSVPPGQTVRKGLRQVPTGVLSLYISSCVPTQNVSFMKAEVLMFIQYYIPRQ